MQYNIIQSIHLIIVIIIIVSIFLPNKKLKEFVLSLLILLIIKYLSGYERCGLTEIEYIMKGEKYQEGFLYRIIKPIVTIPESYFKNFLFVIHCVYIYILFKQIKQIRI
jgi:hypothetical protein